MGHEVDEELQRLASNPAGSSAGDVMIGVRVQCEPGAAETVLARTKEIMTAVLSAGIDSADVGAWRAILPSWFVDACAPERTAEEAARWLQWWRRLPADRQAEVSESTPWSLGDWLWWFRPGADERQWTWWSAEVQSDAEVLIVLAAQSWPVAHGAMDWIARAAGGTSVEEEPA